MAELALVPHVITHVEVIAAAHGRVCAQGRRELREGDGSGLEGAGERTESMADEAGLGFRVLAIQISSFGIARA